MSAVEEVDYTIPAEKLYAVVELVVDEPNDDGESDVQVYSCPASSNWLTDVKRVENDEGIVKYVATCMWPKNEDKLNSLLEKRRKPSGDGWDSYPCTKVLKFCRSIGRAKEEAQKAVSKSDLSESDAPELGRRLSMKPNWFTFSREQSEGSAADDSDSDPPPLKTLKIVQGGQIDKIKAGQRRRHVGGRENVKSNPSASSQQDPKTSSAKPAQTRNSADKGDDNRNGNYDKGDCSSMKKPKGSSSEITKPPETERNHSALSDEREHDSPLIKKKGTLAQISKQGSLAVGDDGDENRNNDNGNSSSMKKPKDLSSCSSMKKPKGSSSEITKPPETERNRSALSDEREHDSPLIKKKGTRAQISKQGSSAVRDDGDENRDNVNGNSSSMKKPKDLSSEVKKTFPTEKNHDASSHEESEDDLVKNNWQGTKILISDDSSEDGKNMDKSSPLLVQDPKCRKNISFNDSNNIEQDNVLSPIHRNPSNNSRAQSTPKYRKQSEEKGCSTSGASVFLNSKSTPTKKIGTHRVASKSVTFSPRKLVKNSAYVTNFTFTREMQELRKDLRALQISVNKIYNCVCPIIERVDENEERRGMPAVPVDCFENMIIWEKFLQDHDNSLNVVRLLTERCVVTSLRDSVYSMLKFLLSNKLASSFNYKGKNKKDARFSKVSFAGTRSCTALNAALKAYQTNLKKTNTALEYSTSADSIGNAISLWLKDAPKRYLIDLKGLKLLDAGVTKVPDDMFLIPPTDLEF